MLYDPKWQSQVWSDPFSLDSLIAWLEKQPADKTYCYHEGGHCLLTGYFTEVGYRNVHVFCDGFWHGEKKIPGWVGYDEAIQMERIETFPKAFDHIAAGIPATFGAALERARKART